MNANLLPLIDTWKSLSVLVIGDVMLDCYLTGSADRLCQEAPVPVVAIADRQDYPGGAANTAANLKSLGATVDLLSMVGSDLEGDRLRQVLTQRGISTRYLLTSTIRTTLVKQRVMVESHVLVRLDSGSTTALDPVLEDQIIERLEEQFADYDAVIVSDYGYGILTPRVIQTLVDLQQRYHQTVIVDAKQLGKYRQMEAIAVKPNYQEAIQLLALPKQADHRIDQLLPYGDALLELTGAAIATVTLDTEGALVFERGQVPFHLPAHPVPPNQTSGAGDTFVSVLCLSLAAGASTPEAATLATEATALVVRQTGTTTCPLEELRRSILPRHHKVMAHRLELSSYLHTHRTAGHTLVLTNGCFDILHSGHITYLAQAKALGDILIVGVNTDESVKQLKGPTRPVNSLGDRMAILAALGCVDYVVPFDELTPHNLIRIVCPNLFVKGGDYTRDTLPEADLVEELGGQVIVLPYVGDRSTTRLIQYLSNLSQTSSDRTVDRPIRDWNEESYPRARDWKTILPHRSDASTLPSPRSNLKLNP